MNSRISTINTGTPRATHIAFLDRDGVLNRDTGYVSQPHEWEWVDGAIQAIQQLNSVGFRVVVVTNQSGIARGYYSEQQFHDLMAWVQHSLAGYKAHLDRYYFCPHHPTHGIPPYLQSCECRKPGPGMLLQALDDFSAEASNCFMIGDKQRDLDAARCAGIPAFLFNQEDSLSNCINGLLEDAEWKPFSDRHSSLTENAHAITEKFTC